jgi:hypothetical protein
MSCNNDEVNNFLMTSPDRNDRRNSGVRKNSKSITGRFYAEQPGSRCLRSRRGDGDLARSSIAVLRPAMLGSRCTLELRHNRGGLILPASAVRMMTGGDPHGGSSDPTRIGSYGALKAFMISAGDLDHERLGRRVVGRTRSPRGARRGPLGGLSGRATTGRRMPPRHPAARRRGVAVLLRGGASRTFGTRDWRGERDVG